MSCVMLGFAVEHTDLSIRSRPLVVILMLLCFMREFASRSQLLVVNFEDLPTNP